MSAQPLNDLPDFHRFVGEKIVSGGAVSPEQVLDEWRALHPASHQVREPTPEMHEALADAVAVPIYEDGHGGLRVTGTRVLLERIVNAFDSGATPEGIVQSYDTLHLTSVYAVVAWYLRNQVAVAEYMGRREEEAEVIQKKIEANQPDRTELRARLMARLAKKEVAHAPPAQ